MRKGLGILALVLGVGALCWYGAERNAKRIEQAVTDGANGAIASAVHKPKITVSGRDIEISGTADSANERESLLKSLGMVKGHRVVRDKLEVLSKASPYTFSAEKTEKGISVSGNVPTEEARSGIGIAMDGDASALKLASGAPEAWSLVAEDGVSALSKLESGTFSMSGKTITLSGVAKTPADGEAALAELKGIPAGYKIDSAFDYLDDGKPGKFDLTYSASEGASVSGKLFGGLTREKIAAALGLKSVSGDDVETTEAGDAGTASSLLKKLSGWLPEFETLDLKVSEVSKPSDGRGAAPGGDDDFDLTGKAAPGADLELLNKGLSKDLGEVVGGEVSVEAITDLPPEGTSRVNAATGVTEVLTGGYWLPQMDFTADYDTCRERAKTFASKRDVNFVTASARLDARSLRVINAMTSIVKKCVEAGALRVEVGGHTDSQGDAAFNKTLSQERAGAVVAALHARGIPDEAITAVGYGDTQPIADNGTDEGRAANRRVTLVFSQ